ncbi:MAG: RQC domain-containing protein, partial [Pyrinomonadaceae bacterium]
EKAGHIERGAAAENRAAVRLVMSPQAAREAVAARRGAQTKQVLFGLLGGYEVNQRADTELDTAEFAETLGLELTSLRRALATLAESEIISYQPARRTRGVLLLDERPAERLRIRPQDLARRAALEQRKLREMISFCYTEDCYRAFILNYFGDRSHPATCGTCGNCAPAPGEAKAAEGKTAPVDPLRQIDRFVMDHVPVALDLDEELGEQSRRRRARAEAEASVGRDDGFEGGVPVTEARELTPAEAVTVRKILACAARMQGRFGKGLLAATLRGSRAKNVTQAGLDRLSTYGILGHLTQDEILLYIDALVSAQCLAVTAGAYPTVSLTALGGEVMRERTDVKLALPSQAIVATPSRRGAHDGAG